MMTISRVGLGYDLHRTQVGRRLVLGGIEIESDFGLAGHSDADVVVHAVIDALLGAAGLDDIGTFFPDNDPTYKDADSTELLKVAYGKILSLGYKIVNLDVNIIAERPKLGPYKKQMRENLANQLSIDPQALAIKAKTNEGVDAVGQGQAIACQAIVGLTQIS